MGKLFSNIRKQLTDAGIEPGEAQAFGFMLMEWAAGLSRVDVLAGSDDELPSATQERLWPLVARLVKGEPIQYVIGTAPFCGLSIGVRPGVLIPRPETEELVEAVSKRAGSSILDIGTGSGCIALALKHLCPSATVTAFDISAEALHIAADNARRLGLDIGFEQHDILAMQPDGRRWDTIVSNPPYICDGEKCDMQATVTDYEPHIALFVPDSDPLLFYTAITRFAMRSLKAGGLLAFETNRRFAAEVGRLLCQSGFAGTEVLQDSFGNDRIVIGTYSETT